MRIFLLVVFLLGIVFSQSQLRAETVESIINNPGNYNGESVTVEGVVVQYVEGNASTTSFYILKGYYGGKIKVNTASSKPEVNQKYRVSGIVYIDPISRQPFISEQSKSMIGLASSTTSGEGKANSAPNNNQSILIFSLLILLIIATIIFFVWQKNNNQKVFSTSAPVSSHINNIPGQLTQGSGTMPASHANDHSNWTVKIPPQKTNATLKFIPGKFEVLTTIDKGKILGPLRAYPSQYGSVVTIGRGTDKVSPDRIDAHIEISDALQTVSRLQAEIIYKNGKIYIKNLSTTNLTKVNGIDLQPQHEIELRPGTIIEMGELKLKYLQ